MRRPPRPVIFAGIVAVAVALALAGWAWWRDRGMAGDVLQASGRIEVT